MRDIPLPTSNRGHPSPAVDGGDNLAVAADLCLLAQGQLQRQQTDPWYRVDWDSGKQQLDVGVQHKAIAAGEALTLDYGVQWWTQRVTGVTWNEWMTTGTLSCRRCSADLFYRMQESVLDYTPLLGVGWDKRLSNATSELERETVMMEMCEYLDERGRMLREFVLSQILRGERSIHTVTPYTPQGRASTPPPLHVTMNIDLAENELPARPDQSPLEGLAGNSFPAHMRAPDCHPHQPSITYRRRAQGGRATPRMKSRR